MSQGHNKQLKEKGKMNSVLFLFSSFFPGTCMTEAVNCQMLPTRPIRPFDR